MYLPALSREAAYGGVVRSQRIPEILQPGDHVLSRVILCQLVGYIVGLIEYEAENGLKVFCLYGLLNIGRGRLSYLRRDRIPLLILVIGERRLFIEQSLLEVIHVVCEIVFEYNCGVVAARLHTRNSLISRIREAPSYLVVRLQIFTDLISHVDVSSVIEIEARVTRSDSYLYAAGVGVRVAVGVDVDPRVQSRKHRNGHYNSQRKKAPA